MTDLDAQIDQGSPRPIDVKIRRFDIVLFRASVIFAVASLGVLVLVEYIQPHVGMSSIESIPRSTYLLVDYLSFLGLPIFVLSIPYVALFTLFFVLRSIYWVRGKNRKNAMGCILACCIGAVYFVVLLGKNYIPNNRDEGFGIVTSNGKQIVGAVDEYHEKHGVYPEDLDALYPEFISAIPEPGIHAALSWNYRVVPTGDNDKPFYLDVIVSPQYLEHGYLSFQGYGAEIDSRYNGWRYIPKVR